MDAADHPRDRMELDETVVTTVSPPEESERASHLLDQFLQCLERGERPDPDAWLAQFPDEASCLRPQLELVLELHGAFGVPSRDRHPASTQPRQIGHYAIVRELGRGGMGIVYEAQDQSLGRRVALKVLPFAAILSEAQLTRFRIEAQAAAQLHHPNIVPVYSVGVDRGIHYFAMQYVNGQPLDVAIRELRERELPRDDDYFRKVAQVGCGVAFALQHAHERGILHRDIKPSNLLLDPSGKVWVTDFGLARVPGEVSHTRTGDILGSARYMSPEQAAGQKAFVDARSDVYSLGVTLYEMLTLQPAYPAESQEQFLHQIAHDEPLSIRRINSGVPPSLAAIVTKAMNKEASQRYASAADLAADLQRFLDHLPTLAEKSKLRDHCRRWLRRHQRWVRAASLLGVLLSVGSLLGMTLIWKEQQRTAAALKEAQTQFGRAEENFRMARLAVDDFGMTMSERLAQIPGTESVRREILTQALQYYQSFIAQAKRDTVLQQDIAAAHGKIGTLYEQLGDFPQALEAYEQAIAHWSRIRDTDPSDAAQDEALANRARTRNNRGLLLARMGRVDDGERDLARAANEQQSLLDAGGDSVELVSDLACTRANQAMILIQQGEREQARQRLESAVELQRRGMDRHQPTETQPSRLAIELHHLASLYVEEDLPRASQLAEEALAIQQNCANLYPDSLAARHNLALGLGNLAAIRSRAGEIRQAADSLAQAVEQLEQLVLRNPAATSYRCDLAIHWNNLGRTQLLLEQYPDALASFEQAATNMRPLLAMSQGTVEYLVAWSGAEFNRGVAQFELGLESEARKTIDAAISVQKQACQRAPQDRRFTEALRHQELTARRLFGGKPSAENRSRHEAGFADSTADETREKIRAGDPSSKRGLSQEL